MENKKHTSLIEEITNSITHGVGLGLAIVAAGFLLYGNNRSDLLRMIGFGIFGLSVVLTYTFSTLYHSLYFTKAKPIFKRLDHSIIFLLISGTYTAFILIALRSLPAFILLFLVWLLSILGIVYKSIFINKFNKLEVFIYIFLGWVGIVLFRQLTTSLPLPAIVLIILGGCFYTFGIVFYSWMRLKFNHGIWHLFVLGGTTCHYLALLYL